MLVFFWTDVLIFVLLAAAIVFAVYTHRREHLRAPWRQVGRSRVAMGALVVLGAYVVVGLLDSVHYRQQLEAGRPAGRASIRTRSSAPSTGL